MKICSKCGYRDFKPEEKCPECENKYDASYSCNPLSSSSEMRGLKENGYVTKGDPNSRCNKD